jgi:hypothetical protein
MTWAWGALAYCGRLAQVGTPGRGKTLTLPVCRSLITLILLT